MKKKLQFKSDNFLKLKKQYSSLYIFSLILFPCGLLLLASTSKSVLLAREIQKTHQIAVTKQSFVADAVKRSGPGIVTIESKRKVIASDRNILPPGLWNDPYFEKFFGFPKIQSPQQRIERGQGSGIIFSSKGLVLTNAHVVDQSDEIIVGLSDGRRIAGRVVGQDYLTDLAVVQLDGSEKWTQVLLGNSDQIEVGDWAIAVGNPYGLEKTVTLGIISNLNRNVSQLGISDKRLNLIQTDAAINPGNSGGPLLNSEGEVIGINTLVRSGPGAGLGFAIPINKAIEIASQLVLNGKVIHPMIGVSLSPVEYSPNSSSQKKLIGALIIYIVPGGPAERSGLKPNDIVIEINQENIKSPQDVVNAINSNGIKKTMKFIILRDNRKLKFNIKPEDMKYIFN